MIFYYLLLLLLFFFFSSQENKRRTKYISKNLNPVWDHTVIYGNMHREELQYKMLEFTLWDYDRFKANDFLGQVTIDLKGID
jgi:Ca2+-dependent lipid-binding protein